LANTLGVANPLRYRGYIYDEETGLYYLQSRYYNPEWGRFINADAIFVFRLLNAFSYCYNNPINFSDKKGLVGNTLNDGGLGDGSGPADLTEIAGFPSGAPGEGPCGACSGEGFLDTAFDSYCENFRAESTEAYNEQLQEVNNSTSEGNTNNETNISRGPYPQVIDPRTGENIPYPEGNNNIIDKSLRTDYNRGQDRYNYITEWYNRSYPTPDGGWDGYELHHIKPLARGGDNSFDNIVPLLQPVHALFNRYWVTID
jgi:RHS repeat-associated protein